MLLRTVTLSLKKHVNSTPPVSEDWDFLRDSSWHVRTIMTTILCVSEIVNDDAIAIAMRLMTGVSLSIGEDRVRSDYTVKAG